MTCPDCKQAALQSWDAFRPNCKGCSARAIARSDEARQVASSGFQTRTYLAALRAVGVTHDDIVQAAASDFRSRSATWML